MVHWQWILGMALGAALLVLGVLVLAAAAASRSEPHAKELTPTQQTENPYRRFYRKK